MKKFIEFDLDRKNILNIDWILIIIDEFICILVCRFNDEIV